ncbi:hypothetical protein DERP_011033 [Dermatophagoides pteronyssinus]|uniref:Uncharacterized protein n=1 Tax=Dermatophagoides pteronyssinus TaxID=6956 RepID=A0ABQ8JV55_DERPT|nr:hypothetical protein DERP_011033 [Dermatophagoides pteronyssinus]
MNELIEVGKLKIGIEIREKRIQKIFFYHSNGYRILNDQEYNFSKKIAATIFAETEKLNHSRTPSSSSATFKAS